MQITPVPAWIWPIASQIIFDCDSTLCAVEGIDELARLIESEQANAYRTEPASPEAMAVKIASLTKRAMEGEIPLETVYGQRLVTINPNQTQVRQIAMIYRQTVIRDAREIITALQALGAGVFIVSGGLIEAVRDFGVWLGVPKEHIYAVNMEYDQLSGHWWRYWEHPGSQNPQANFLAYEANPLTATRGKNHIIAQIRADHPGRAIFIGDGLSDLEAGQEVDLFIGFGGVKRRDIVERQAQVYIQSPSLAAILPLAFGGLGYIPRYADLWSLGMQQILSGEVRFNPPELQHTFLNTLSGMRAG